MLFFVIRERVLLEDVRKLISLPLFFSLGLQSSEMCFYCCAHTYIGAYPDNVVLIYGIVNTFGWDGGWVLPSEFVSLVL